MKKSILFLCAVLLTIQANPMNPLSACRKPSQKAIEAEVRQAIIDGDAKRFTAKLEQFIQEIKDIGKGDCLVYYDFETKKLEPVIFMVLKKAYDRTTKQPSNHFLPGHNEVSAIDFVRLLVEHNDGIPIDQPDNSNKTPLWYAIHNFDFPTVAYLLKRGANPDGVDKKETFLDNVLKTVISMPSWPRPQLTSKLEAYFTWQTELLYAMEQVVKLLISSGAKEKKNWIVGIASGIQLMEVACKENREHIDTNVIWEPDEIKEAECEIEYYKQSIPILTKIVAMVRNMHKKLKKRLS